MSVALSRLPPPFGNINFEATTYFSVTFLMRQFDSPVALLSIVYNYSKEQSLYPLNMLIET